jgi:hypothetical protein
MPFDVSYAPISASMGAAQQAGSAQGTVAGQQTGQEDIFRMQQALQQAAALQQQKHASEIQAALEARGQNLQGQSIAAQRELSAAQMIAQQQYHQENLAQLGAYRQGMTSARQESADSSATRAGAAQQNADTNTQKATAQEKVNDARVQQIFQNLGMNDVDADTKEHVKSSITQAQSLRHEAETARANGQNDQAAQYDKLADQQESLVQQYLTQKKVQSAGGQAGPGWTNGQTPDVNKGAPGPNSMGQTIQGPDGKSYNMGQTIQGPDGKSYKVIGFSPMVQPS